MPMSMDPYSALARGQGTSALSDRGQRQIRPAQSVCSPRVGYASGSARAGDHADGTLNADDRALP